MNKKIMSLVIISMMMIVALGVVFADEGGCPCNSHPIKDIENTKGAVQPLGECMRTWIEKDCGPKFYDKGRFVSCKNHSLWPYYPYKLVTWNWHWYRYCEKWRVWYDICQHKELYREYLGVFREEGWHYTYCECYKSCDCICWP